MKPLYAVLITLLICVAAQSREDKPTIKVHAGLDSIKAELIRVHSDGYTLCKEQPSQLVFCRTPNKPKRAFVDHTERSFTLISSDGSTEIIANSEVRRVNVFGGERQVRGMDKHDKAELQTLLDKLKATLESNSPSS